MSSRKTSKLNLHAWDATDAFRRDEFNENFEALDKNAETTWDEVMKKADADTVSALQSAVKTKAEASDLNSMKSAMPHIATGIYKGTGTVGHSITFPFEPKLVILSRGYLTSSLDTGATGSNVTCIWYTGIELIPPVGGTGSVQVTVSGNTMTFLGDGRADDSNAARQYNSSTYRYFWVAIG